jgi:hypothetical protein
MKADKNIENPNSRRRLRRKVLERWENEGGKICTDPGTMPEIGMPGKRDMQNPSLSDESLMKVDDGPSSRKRQAK